MSQSTNINTSSMVTVRKWRLEALPILSRDFRPPLAILNQKPPLIDFSVILHQLGCTADRFQNLFLIGFPVCIIHISLPQVQDMRVVLLYV